MDEQIFELTVFFRLLHKILAADLSPKVRARQLYLLLRLLVLQRRHNDCRTASRADTDRASVHESVHELAATITRNIKVLLEDRSHEYSGELTIFANWWRGETSQLGAYANACAMAGEDSAGKIIYFSRN